MRKLTLTLAALLVLAAGALAVPYDVGQTLPAGAAWKPRGVADQAVTSPTVLQLDPIGRGAELASAVVSGSATIYLYETNASRVVQRVYGPLELRSYAPPRDLLTMTGKVHAIHVEAVTGECIVTVGF